ncbi:hypothetical protein D3C78_1303420 [compost metagenome]
MNEELILIQGFTQVGVQPQIFKNTLVHFRREDGEFTAAAFFCRIHRGICVTNNTFTIRTMLRSKGDAQGTTGINLNETDTERLT